MSVSLKYTLSRKRKKWVQMVHPGLLELVNILQDIPWNEYYYEGSSLVEFSGNSTVQKTVQLKAKTPTYPYMLFGGICYNILHKEYKGTNINNFLDYTGDIDVHLYCPEVEIQNTPEIEDFLKENETEDTENKINSISKSDESINDMVKHYMHWLFAELEQIITEDYIYQHFPKSKSIEESEISVYLRENADTNSLTPEFGFRKTNIADKAYLLCFIDNSTIRIQLIMSCGVRLDHALEFIFVLPENTNTLYSYDGTETNYFPKITNSNILKIDGFTIQNPSKLMLSNVEAYLERVKYVDNEEYAHKAMNHAARIIYLLVLSKRNKKKFLMTLVHGAKLWIHEIYKQKEPIVFYRISTKGKYQKIEIEISEFLTAFQSVLRPVQFIQMTDIYDKIKVGKIHEENAFKNLMTIVNGNRFFNKPRSSKNKNKNSVGSTKSKRSLARTKSSNSTRKRSTQSL